jgi:ABC-type amino acid transport substrate-binding protein
MFSKIGPLLKGVVYLCLVISITFGCNQPGSGSSSGLQTVFDGIIKNKTIRVGYISYPPSFIKDPNSGALTGIMHDVLVEAGKSMELKIDFVEEVAWGTMIEAVQSGKVDLVCTGLWPNSTRGKFADFTAPIYYSPIRAYVKAGNNKFDGNINSVNSKNIRIATIDGEMTSIIAKFDFPNAQTEALTQNSDVSQVLLNVATGKADITFVEPVIANEYLSNNPGSIQEVRNIEPLRVFPNVMMIPKGDVRFQSMLNTSFEELSNNGIIDKIISKYEKFPGSFFRRQLPYRLK